MSNRRASGHERLHFATVVCTTDFRPLAGGIAEFMHSLWHHVARYRAVTVMTTVPAHGETWEHRYQLEQMDGVPDARAARSLAGGALNPLRKLSTARYLFAVDRRAGQLVTRLQREFARPWVYIGVWNLAAHAWCRELRRAQVPYSLFAHGTEIVRPLPGLLARMREQDFLNASEIIANSNGTAMLVARHLSPDLPVSVVRPGIAPAPPEANSVHAAEVLRAQLNVSGNMLLTVGRLVPRKGIDLVLRSLSQLGGEFGNVTYVIAGDGPERIRLERMASELQLGDRVRFLGRVDDATKWSLYRACDLFVMPNRVLADTDWEGFGIVFLEAAAAGRPVIGGRNGGVPDAVQEGVTGMLVDPEREGDIARALRTLLSDGDLRRRMGAAAADRARREFDWDRIARRFCAERNMCVETE